MLDEFARYIALQRDQAPLASLLIYLKRKGGYVQLNQIWREMGPTGGGPFWNQTTLLNKLDKLNRLDVISMERRILPSARSGSKKKANTFYRLNPTAPIYPYIFGMLRIYREEPDRYSSELVASPLDHLLALAGGRSSVQDPMLGRELEVAVDLIGEVFSVGRDEVKRMIRERMEKKGLVRERRTATPPVAEGEAKSGVAGGKRPKKTSRKKEKRAALPDEDLANG